MNNLAIIPARSGSKGLPDKNIKVLCGKPLMAYSIEAALHSQMFSEVMVSTDSEKYAQIARAWGAKVPFLRSAENASDKASTWDMIREVLAAYEKQGKIFDTVCLLQPTSPLRNSEDIVSAYALLQHKNANAVISVCEAEHTPRWMNTLPDTLSMDDFIPSEDNTQRQKFETYYRLNGAIYIVHADYIRVHSSIYHHSFAYIMPQERSLDIDSVLDFKVAETLLKNF